LKIPDKCILTKIIKIDPRIANLVISLK